MKLLRDVNFIFQVASYEFIYQNVVDLKFQDQFNLTQIGNWKYHGKIIQSFP